MGLRAFMAIAASPLSAYVAGRTLVVDGGLTLLAFSACEAIGPSVFCCATCLTRTAGRIARYGHRAFVGGVICGCDPSPPWCQLAPERRTSLLMLSNIATMQEQVMGLARADCLAPVTAKPVIWPPLSNLANANATRARRWPATGPACWPGAEQPRACPAAVRPRARRARGRANQPRWHRFVC